MKSQEKNVLKMPEDLINDMNKHLPGNLTIEDVQRLRMGKPFKVLFICSDALMGTDVVDMLDLSVRSSNALKRAGYKYVGELIDRLDSFDDLKNVRNLGTKSKAEIMGRLFFYQYSLIPEDKRTSYMRKILELNGIK